MLEKSLLSGEEFLEKNSEDLRILEASGGTLRSMKRCHFVEEKRMEKHGTTILKINELTKKESPVICLQGRKTLLDEVEKTFS